MHSWTCGTIGTHTGQVTQQVCGMDCIICGIGKGKHGGFDIIGAAAPIGPTSDIGANGTPTGMGGNIGGQQGIPGGAIMPGAGTGQAGVGMVMGPQPGVRMAGACRRSTPQQGGVMHRPELEQGALVQF